MAVPADLVLRLMMVTMRLQDTAYVNPCYSELKQCGVPDYLGIDQVDQTWCNCDLHDVCPVRHILSPGTLHDQKQCEHNVLMNIQMLRSQTPPCRR